MATAAVQKFRAGDLYITNNLCIIIECKSCDEKFGVYTKFLDHIFGKHFEDWIATNKLKHVPPNESTNTEKSNEFPTNNEQCMEIECINVKEYSDPNDLLTEILEPTEDDPVAALNDIIEDESQPKPVAEIPKQNVRPVKTYMKQTTDKTKERKYKCEICGFAFAESFNLRNHVQRHSNIKPYSCLKCDKGFYTSTELKEHTRRHNNELPYVCTYCGKGCVSIALLNKHERTHTGVRKYKCDQCDKRFYDSNQLKLHYVVHTQERNYSCEKCNAKFSRKKSLRAHMKLHENALRYECMICHMRFNQKPSLLWHIKSKHDVLHEDDNAKSSKDTSAQKGDEYDR